MFGRLIPEDDRKAGTMLVFPTPDSRMRRMPLMVKAMTSSGIVHGTGPLWRTSWDSGARFGMGNEVLCRLNFGRTGLAPPSLLPFA